jgi:hypothetical protein
LKKLGSIGSSSLDLAKAYAEKSGLQIDWTNPATAVPRLAVTQTPKEFDFPGIPWPPQFHYAGPFHESEGHAFLQQILVNALRFFGMTDRARLYLSTLVALVRAAR